MEYSLDLDFKKSYFNDSTRKYQIPIVSFEIYKLFLSPEVKNSLLGESENVEGLILTELITKIKNEKDILRKMIYRLLLNKWYLVHENPSYLEEWKEKVDKLDARTRKRLSKLKSNKPINPKTKKKYLKIYGKESQPTDYLYETFIEEGMFPEETWLMKNYSEDFYQQAMSDQLLNHLHLLSLDYLRAEKSFFENESVTFVSWLLWILKQESSLMIEDDLDELYQKLPLYQPMVNSVNELSIIIDEELKLESFWKSNFETTFTVLEFIKVCNENAVREEDNELLKLVSCPSEDLYQVLCCNFFSFDSLKTFMINHGIRHHYVNHRYTYTQKKGWNERKRKNIEMKLLRKYFSTKSVSRGIVSSAQKNYKLTNEEVVQYLTAVQNEISNITEIDDLESIIRAGLSPEKVGETKIEREERLKKYRFLYDLLKEASLEATLEYHETLNNPETESLVTCSGAEMAKNILYWFDDLMSEINTPNYLIEVVEEMKKSY